MAPPPVKSTPLPQHPWEHLATDILGPLPSGESLLVTVDYFSRFFEVDILRGTTSAAVITRLHAHFARYGLPRTLRTDNGPQFASEEFAAFLAEMGVDHLRNTPLWPRANGEVERQNRSLLKILQIAHAEHRPWRPSYSASCKRTGQRLTRRQASALPLSCSATRSALSFQPTTQTTPLSATNHLRPSCEIATRSTSAPPPTMPTRQSHATDRDTSPGDQVWLRNTAPANKLIPTYHPEPFKVTARHGDQVTVESTLTGSTLKRNLQHTKPVVAELPEGGEGQTTQEQPAAQKKKSATQPDKAERPQRPQRNAAPPARFKDYHTSFR